MEPIKDGLYYVTALDGDGNPLSERSTVEFKRGERSKIRFSIDTQDAHKIRALKMEPVGGGEARIQEWNPNLPYVIGSERHDA